MTPALSLRGVRVRFGSHTALDGVDLDVGAGERVALVGPSGAGKSTLLGLPTGAVRPTAGRVEVLGQPLAELSPSGLRALRRRVGTIHQHLDLIGPLRVVHNVNAGRLGSWTRRRALRSLVRPVDVVGVTEVLARVGIASKVRERTDRLSGGEQQRVALARLLVQDPEVVLADEPVSSLDPAHAEEVLDLLAECVAERGAALLVSLHDFELARRRCDRVVGIRNGRVAFDLPAGDVTAEHARALYLLER